MRRVVITGMAVVSPIGNDWETFPRIYVPATQELNTWKTGNAMKK